jgi:putative ATP-dependent endonuclease of OLD family
MYISKFSAFNYRSLKQVSVRLENGKNIIVGKNNSGKSNIIKGLEILVGEKFPTYQNFTDNDFYTYENVDIETGEITEIVSETLYLEAELEGRDFDEELIGKIKKQTAFSKIKDIGQLYTKEENGDVKINHDFFQNLDEIEQRDEISIIGSFANGGQKKTDWKKPDVLLAFLKQAKKIKLFFSKSRSDSEKSGFGIIIFDQQNSIWVSHFLSKKLRDSLITTTVISALRSHKEDLRLVHYTWFGKLISGLWYKNKNTTPLGNEKTYESLIKEKSGEIKQFVDAVFHKETTDIRELLEGAIAHKAVSFKFMNDSQNELYKNIQLFVNDGIDRPLNEKGTGIQSAIIISLFSLYCNNYHNSSSLLIAEEPELFLHPQARRVISAELDKFLLDNTTQSRQLIISTHSIEYLRNVDPYNIIRVYKDDMGNCSIAKQLDEGTSKEITIELKRFLWSNNTEIFFSDKVVLVEGAEVYLLTSIVDSIKSTKQELDYRNISVTRANGKGSFLTYVKILKCFDIPFVILGDLDCFKDEVFKLINHFNLTTIKKDIEKIKLALNSLPTDYNKIIERTKNINTSFDVQDLQTIFEKFTNNEIKSDDEKLLKMIEFMKSRYTKGNKLETILKTINQHDFDKLQDELRRNKIFIWSKGELEDYYTTKSKLLSGSKDIKALQISYLLESKTHEINDLLVNIDEIQSLTDLILS